MNYYVNRLFHLDFNSLIFHYSFPAHMYVIYLQTVSIHGHYHLPILFTVLRQINTTRDVIGWIGGPCEFGHVQLVAGQS